MAETADLSLAATTFAVLSIPLLINIAGLDPLPTSTGWAIQPILGRVFLKLTIPSLLEVGVKQFLDMFERYMISGAAFGRHVLWILD